MKAIRNVVPNLLMCVGGGGGGRGGGRGGVMIEFFVNGSFCVTAD